MYITKKEAERMADQILKLYSSYSYRMDFTVNIKIAPQDSVLESKDACYYVSVEVRKKNEDKYRWFECSTDENLGDLKDFLDKGDDENEENDDQFLRRLFPSIANPMDDIDRLIDIVKGRKEADHE